MKFLDSAPKFLFFTGKGGVGKTSIACASAVSLSESGKRVLLVSTDPASNIGQVFSISIGNNITEVPKVGGLSAIEIDPHAAAAAYRDKIVGPVKGILPEAIVRSIEEQLSGACTTEIAAFDEFTSLLTDDDLVKSYDYIIFDTAPTGHTIRLLQLPGAWTGFLEDGKGDASCLGPLAGLEKQKDKYQEAVDVLSNPKFSRLVLVARAQKSTLVEAGRTFSELLAIGFNEQYLVVNGVMPESEIGIDTLAEAIYMRERKALQEIPEVLKSLPIDIVSLKPFNLVGLDALRNLFKSDSLGSQIVDDSSIELVDIRDLSSLVDELAKDEHGLIMLMGKGGVGKTTMAAAIAVALASKGFPVHLSTSDPAAHLNKTLGKDVEGLTVSKIDPHAETERYRKHIMEEKGSKLDEHGRALLEEDLRSPCTEEIAIFQAFSRIIKEAEAKFIVMDTAPTGHTLLLLDATGAYHREVSRKLDSEGSHVLTPLMRLQDPKQTKVILVTLAETTPVLEAKSLQADLERSGIKPWAWIVNNSILLAGPKSGILKKRARNEIIEIKKVMDVAPRYALVPLMKTEPIGQEKLLELVSID